MRNHRRCNETAGVLSHPFLISITRTTKLSCFKGRFTEMKIVCRQDKNTENIVSPTERNLKAGTRCQSGNLTLIGHVRRTVFI